MAQKSNQTSGTQKPTLQLTAKRLPVLQMTSAKVTPVTGVKNPRLAANGRKNA